MKNDTQLFPWIVPKYGRPPLENITVDTIDLSEYLDFFLKVQFGIGIHLVKKRARLCLEDGLRFYTELAQACDTGYRMNKGM